MPLGGRALLLLVHREHARGDQEAAEDVDARKDQRAEAEELVSKYRIGPLFTPPSVSTLDGTLATITSPGSTGGANWPGGSYDPETHKLYLY